MQVDCAEFVKYEKDSFVPRVDSYQGMSGEWLNQNQK